MSLSTLTTSENKAVGAASAQFAAMVVGGRYRLVSTTNAWVRFGTNPTAAANTSQNHYLPAGQALYILCEAGATICAIIQDSAGGNATLSVARRTDR